MAKASASVLSPPAATCVPTMAAAVEAATAGVFPLRQLLTHSYPLNGLSRAMQDMEERPAGFLKGWIRYD